MVEISRVDTGTSRRILLRVPAKECLCNLTPEDVSRADEKDLQVAVIRVFSYRPLPETQVIILLRFGEVYVQASRVVLPQPYWLPPFP